jgi:hypothetical protein
MKGVLHQLAWVDEMCSKQSRLLIMKTSSAADQKILHETSEAQRQPATFV